MTKIQNPKPALSLSINNRELGKTNGKRPITRSILLNVKSLGHWLLKFGIYL
jgi:hypothetical protein